ncbi:hypothetical protein ABH940_007029 [Streptacidiphilus sp. BW17]|jgi:hypothetical protein
MARSRAYILSTAFGVAAYASMLLHKSWIDVVATPVAVVASIAYYVMARGQARKRGASAESS